MSQAGRRQTGRKNTRGRMKERALARFGLEVGKAVRQMLVERVRSGEVKYARKLTHSRTVIVLDYAGREITFIYCNTSKEILTFLAPDAPETADWRNSQATAMALFGLRENAL